MGFMRAEQAFPVRANSSSSFLVISLMNPQTLKRYKRGVCVGSAKHLRAKPDSHSCHVHRIVVSGMGGTQKLQNDVERTRMAKKSSQTR